MLFGRRMIGRKREHCLKKVCPVLQLHDQHTMMKISRHARTIVFSVGMASLAPLAQAQAWTLNAQASATTGAYKDSLLRDKLTESGVTVSGEYLDKGGLVLGYGTTRVSMKNGAAAIDQSNLLLSGHLNFQPDETSGRWTARLDNYRINNNNTTGDTDAVRVVATQLSWLAKDKSWYADLGLARSRYQNDLTVNQFTPTLGFGMNDGADWLQLRAYQISGLNPVRAAGKNNTSALEAKWTHYFAPGAAWMPRFASLGVMGGERIYAVDMDAQSVANLADISTGSATLGLGWTLTKNSRMFVLLGQSRFRNVNLANDYKLNVGYVNFSIDWE